ncbi:MAG: cytidylyltransferase domain-containing protein [Candidatus Hodarchaeota archaeon]
MAPMNTIAILQARMGSSRLPGKVLKPILGRPMLELQIERLRRCKRIDRLVVATSVSPEDQAIADLCHRIGVDCLRGDPENVLDRFYQAAKQYDPRHVVRLTGDCPLADPALIDDLVEFYLSNGCDYASNCHEPSFPDGLDAEILSFSALEQAWREAELPSHLEHVTPFIRAHPERFKIASYRYHTDLSHLRWVVDEPEDLEFVRRVYEALYPIKPEFGTEDILALLKRRPELLKLNEGIRRNEGAKKSIVRDREFLAEKRVLQSKNSKIHGMRNMKMVDEELEQDRKNEKE